MWKKNTVYGIKSGLNDKITSVFLAENSDLAKCYFKAKEPNIGDELYILGRIVDKKIVAAKVFITSYRNEFNNIRQEKLKIESIKDKNDTKEVIEKLFEGKEIC